MYCISVGYMYHISKYVPVWPETSYTYVSGYIYTAYKE